ncbi:S8 family peptidase [Aspergillus fischeri NRRL 181]|uniref:oryzin n=1 Tax=Neosartorya fischeri (strain ATCC 1020 / DSM 3700 / CBS 544.65 / FGSC A1164 / JCM 1740 / NRRL 181 / WB 181) TaxID=331117 RepID=A1DCF8_NEOFI|nr:alkaline serine protease (PR1), putative [Aspergillus fischeri NRRL 181]EAW19518.1 alkaline serine protease (PR1), putative [Aspergillus fischeri NRRL 181]
MTTGQTTVPGQWVVRVKPYLTPELVQKEHLSLLAEKTEDPATPFNVDILQRFDLNDSKGYSAKFDDATKEELERIPHVISIEPEQLYRHCNIQPNSPWGISRVSTRTKLGAPPYSYTYRDDVAGSGTVAYVIDTGINDKHVEFEGRATKGPKFVSDNVSNDEDVHGHGTHCAGTIASRAYGVAKKANVVGVKVFGDRTGTAQTSDIIKALEWVVSDVSVKGMGGRAVVNMSLGGPPSDALDAAVASTVRKGVVVCVAAGNDPEDVNESPAREPLAITVGATDVKDQLANFSSYGKFVDILAPGVDILSCWRGGPTSTKTISGTSMATPHVGGVACCLLSDPSLARGEVTTYDVMSKILILADKNKIAGADARTVNALLHNTTGPMDA